MKLKHSNQEIFLAADRIYHPAVEGERQDRICKAGYVDVVIAGTRRIERVRLDNINTKES